MGITISILQSYQNELHNVGTVQVQLQVADFWDPAGDYLVNHDWLRMQRPGGSNSILCPGLVPSLGWGLYLLRGEIFFLFAQTIL